MISKNGKNRRKRCSSGLKNPNYVSVRSPIFTMAGSEKAIKNRSELPPADKTYTFAFSSDITTRLPWTESRPLQYSVTA